MIFSNTGDEHAREEGRRHADDERLSPLPRVAVKEKSVASPEGDGGGAPPRVRKRDLVGNVGLVGAHLGQPGAERRGGVGEAVVGCEQREV